MPSGAVPPLVGVGTRRWRRRPGSGTLGLVKPVRHDAGADGQGGDERCGHQRQHDGGGRRCGTRRTWWAPGCACLVDAAASGLTLGHGGFLTFGAKNPSMRTTTPGSDPTRAVTSGRRDPRHVNTFTSVRATARPTLSRRWSPTPLRVRRTRCRRCRRATPPAVPRPCADCPGDRAGVPSSATGNCASGSSSASSASSSASVLTRARARRRSPPAGKPLRYQDTCLRNSLQPRSSPMCTHQQLGVPAHHRAPPRRGAGSVADRGPRERRGQVAEQPGTAQAAAADDDTVGAGLLDHPQRVGRLPDVAVAEHRDVDVLDEARRSRPSRPCRSSPGSPYARAARSPRCRTPGRSGRRRGR